MKTAATAQGFVLHIATERLYASYKANAYYLRKVSTCNGNNESTCDSQSMHTSVIRL